MNMKKHRFRPIWLMVLFSVPFILYSEEVAASTTFYVDDDNCPVPGAGTMGDPYCKIQDGIDAATSGDTVQVDSGTYYENITMKSGVVIQGAGQGISIIDGGGQGSVVTTIGVDSNAKLDGFTITGGLNGDGGGMYISGNSSTVVSNCIFLGNSAISGGGMTINGSSPTVTGCTFSGNSATFNTTEDTRGGGGMYIYLGSSPTVINCLFLDNTATNSAGGGILNWYDSSPTVTGCTFSGNSAKWGGGMYNNDSSSPTVTNCIFAGNNASEWGGGMFNNDSSSPTVTGCTFSGNSAKRGGGMYIYNNSSTLVSNCIFLGNAAPFGSGGGIFNQSSSPTLTSCTFYGNSALFGGLSVYTCGSGFLTIANCILRGGVGMVLKETVIGEISVTYSNIEGGYSGTGNIDADPEFVRNPYVGDDGVWGTEDDDDGDLHLTNISPCIDKGDPSASGNTDMDGEPRIVDGDGDGTAVIDMGAYEYIPEIESFPWEIFYPAFIKKK